MFVCLEVSEYAYKIKKRVPKPYFRGGEHRWCIKNGFMSRTLMNRCALHSSNLSASFGGYATIVGGIFSYLGLGKGRKS